MQKRQVTKRTGQSHAARHSYLAAGGVDDDAHARYMTQRAGQGDGSRPSHPTAVGIRHAEARRVLQRPSQSYTACLSVPSSAMLSVCRRGR